MWNFTSAAVALSKTAAVKGRFERYQSSVIDDVPCLQKEILLYTRCPWSSCEPIQLFRTWTCNGSKLVEACTKSCNKGLSIPKPQLPHQLSLFFAVEHPIRWELCTAGTQRSSSLQRDGHSWVVLKLSAWWPWRAVNLRTNPDLGRITEVSLLGCDPRSSWTVGSWRFLGGTL